MVSGLGRRVLGLGFRVLSFGSYHLMQGLSRKQLLGTWGVDHNTVLVGWV